MRLAPSVYYYPNPKEAEEPWAASNCLVFDGPEMFILDPGPAWRWPGLKAALEADGLDPGRLGLALFTHGHLDHFSSAPVLAREYGTVLAMHRLEAEFLASSKSGPKPPGPRPGYLVDEGFWEYGGRRFHLLLTPGHSPGGLTLHWPEGKLLAVGDLYFPGTIGAFHYAGGCPTDMYASVARLEKILDVDTVICGHCPPIIGRDNIRANYQALNREIAEKKAAGIV